MTDHCPACTIRRELTEHRDTTYADWSKARVLLNFAAVLAERACPEYRLTVAADVAAENEESSE